MIDTARIGRIKDFQILHVAFTGFNLDVEIPLWNRQSRGTVAVNAHGAQVNQMDVFARFGNGGEDVMGGVDVVAYRVALVKRRFHRIGRGPLLGEMNHRQRFVLADKGQQFVVLDGDIQIDKGDGLAAYLFPGGQPSAQRLNRGQRCAFQFDIDLTPGEVVNDNDLITGLGKVEAGGPAAEAVATENDDGLRHGSDPDLGGCGYKHQPAVVIERIRQAIGLIETFGEEHENSLAFVNTHFLVQSKTTCTRAIQGLPDRENIDVSRTM